MRYTAASSVKGLSPMGFLMLFLVLGAIFVPGPHKLLSTVTGLLCGFALLAYMSGDPAMSRLGGFALAPAAVMIVVVICASLDGGGRERRRARLAARERWWDNLPAAEDQDIVNAPSPPVRRREPRFGP